jgi:hypothetical protein
LMFMFWIFSTNSEWHLDLNWFNNLRFGYLSPQEHICRLLWAKHWFVDT